MHAPDPSRRQHRGFLRRAYQSSHWFFYAALAAGLGYALWYRPERLSHFFFEMVKVPNGPWVAKCEVTQTQYEEITGENPSYFRDPDKPVDSVSWEDAEAFCTRLTEREHAAARLPPNLKYELPTDSQWDQFSGAPPVGDAVTSLATIRESTEKVGSCPPNALGLRDVVGNLWEWTRSWYDNDVRRKDSNRDLPLVPTDTEATAQGPEETFKVLRGGSWDTTTSDHFDLASRLRYAPGMSNYRTGFRCVVVKIGDK